MIKTQGRSWQGFIVLFITRIFQVFKLSPQWSGCVMYFYLCKIHYYSFLEAKQLYFFPDLLQWWYFLHVKWLFGGDVSTSSCAQKPAQESKSSPLSQASFCCWDRAGGAPKAHCDLWLQQAASVCHVKPYTEPKMKATCEQERLTKETVMMRKSGWWHEHKHWVWGWRVTGIFEHVNKSDEISREIIYLRIWLYYDFCGVL